MSNLNEQQQAVVDCNDDRILVLAGAGAGKTFTMLKRINRLVSDGVRPSAILVLTFTNKAAFDMRDRYKSTYPGKAIPEFRTFHSFCYHLIVTDSAVRKQLGYAKVPNICEEAELKRIKTRAKMQCNIKLSDSKLNGEVPLSNPKEKQEYDIFMKCVKKTLIKENIITFGILADEVSLLFTQNNEVIQHYKNQYQYIFVDEFQDTDPQQVRFISSFHDTKFCVIGDCLQCQPAGTSVWIDSCTRKNIEDIVPGDTVLSYCPKWGYYRKDSNLRIVKAVSSHFADNIVEVASANHSSKYTKDHITYAKIHLEGNEDKRVVYLMHNSEKGWWRIGECALFLNKGVDFGPRHRMHEEKGDQVWILKMCDNSKEASWYEEQLAAFKFGIPDTTWQFSNIYRYTEATMHKLYDNIPDIYARAERCLAYYGLDINHPFFDAKTNGNQHFSKLHQFEIRVCNLIPEVMDIVVPKCIDDSSSLLHNSYEQIMSITSCDSEMVYSLDVEEDHNYIADGVLTHNCIYQFRGCTNEIIKVLAKDSAWTKIKLFENYRSTNQICNFANKMSTYADAEYRIEMRGQRDGDRVEVIPGAHCGYNPVDSYHLSILVDRLKDIKDGKDIAILCRTNKEVSYVCSKLKEEGILFSSGQRNDDALNILKSVVDNDYMLDWLSSLLPAEKYAEYIRLAAQEENPDIFWFADHYNHVESIKERGKTIVKIRNILKSNKPNISKAFDIFKCLGIKSGDTLNMSEEDDVLSTVIDIMEAQGDQNIYVGTIHSSKGLEYDTVYVMGVDDRSFRLGTEDMNNLYYVALTRAKNHLVVFTA